MDSKTLSKICRCSHARRDHHSGNIFEQYGTSCFICGCHYFEVETEAIVQIVTRDIHGRFVRVSDDG